MTTLAEERPRIAPVLGARLQILIVEDHLECAESMAILLRMSGHVVEVALNGQIALEMAESGKPDVVLLDLGLPGSSGHVVAQRLSARRPRKSPLLIAVTGFGQEEDRRRSAESGIDLHLVKPVDPETLQVILARFQRLLVG